MRPFGSIDLDTVPVVFDCCVDFVVAVDYWVVGVVVDCTFDLVGEYMHPHAVQQDFLLFVQHFLEII